jgi:hypothetical protein
MRVHASSAVPIEQPGFCDASKILKKTLDSLVYNHIIAIVQRSNTDPVAV